MSDLKPDFSMPIVKVGATKIKDKYGDVICVCANEWARDRIYEYINSRVTALDKFKSQLKVEG